MESGSWVEREEDGNMASSCAVKIQIFEYLILLMRCE